MAAPGSPEYDRELNPHRDEDEQRNTEQVAATLGARGARVDGSENSEQLVQLLEAVERFEAAVSSLGGDRMVDDQSSPAPDDPDFVLPRRRDDETVAAYTDRVERAATMLERRIR
ncbi:MAG TPA: hypothetical protein VJ672_09120 [Gemmatimonadaceae bacterium]|nr:hypothetical protein [Gemmatimonadaceae bacterium]